MQEKNDVFKHHLYFSIAYETLESISFIYNY